MLSRPDSPRRPRSVWAPRMVRAVALLALASALAACSGEDQINGPGGVMDSPDVIVDAAGSLDAPDTSALSDVPDGAAPDGDAVVAADIADGGPQGDARVDVGADAATDGASDAEDAADVSPPVTCTTHEACVLAFPFVGVCERALCDEGVCVVLPVAECCVDDGGCFDWDPCTSDLCDLVNNVCSGEPVVGCCAGEWLYQDGFEEGGIAWEFSEPEGLASARWFVAEEDARTGAGALHFRDRAVGGYGTGYHEIGEARGPWLTIPGDAERPVLRFDLWLDTEWRFFARGTWEDPSPLVYDRLQLFFEDEEGGRTEIWSSYSVDVRGTTCSTFDCGYQPFALDVSAFRTRRVRPVFVFDSGDHVDNDYGGVRVDNFGLELACGEPPECLTSSDCDDMDPCTNDRCDGGACFYEPSYAMGCCYDLDRANWQFDPLSLSGFIADPSDAMVRWEISDRQALTGESSLRFGNVTNHTYDDPGRAVAGTARSPSVPLANWRRLALYLSVWVDLEPYDAFEPYRDVFQIQLRNLDTGQAEVVWDRAVLLPDQYRTWVSLEFPLDDYMGIFTAVELVFSSGDAEGNTGEGVFVDDIRIVRHCQ